MPTLPLNDILAGIKNTLTTHNRLVLQALPGAGKTTAVPITMLGHLWLLTDRLLGSNLAGWLYAMQRRAWFFY